MRPASDAEQAELAAEQQGARRVKILVRGFSRFIDIGGYTVVSSARCARPSSQASAG